MMSTEARKRRKGQFPEIHQNPVVEKVGFASHQLTGYHD